MVRLAENSVYTRITRRTDYDYNEFPHAGGVTPMEQGGTGADNRKNAAQNLLYLGQNPITSEEDTVTKWLEMGTGVAYFTQKITENQPSVFGFLINIATSDTTNVAQIFLPLGPTEAPTIYFRNGWPGRGWDNQWTAQGTAPAADEPNSDLAATEAGKEQ